MNLPDDADGDALRRLIAHGSDLSKPILVDFQIAVPHEEKAQGLAALLSTLGYAVDIYASPECRLPWTCQCSKQMIASYDAIVSTQKELALHAAPFSGFPDGWGSFGNAEEAS